MSGISTSEVSPIRFLFAVTLLPALTVGLRADVGEAVRSLVPGVSWVTMSDAPPRGIELAAEGPGVSAQFRVRPEKTTVWDSGWLSDGDVNRIHRELALRRRWVKFVAVAGTTVTVASGDGCDGGADGFIQVQGENVRFAGVVYQVSDDCRDAPGAASSGTKPRGAVRFTLRLSEWIPRSAVAGWIQDRRDNEFVTSPPRRRN
jgi:hypothetical protein